MLNDKIEKCTRIISNKYKIIDIIYIFGSHSKDTCNIMSDLDIAISLNKPLDRAKTLDITNDITDIYITETDILTDVVIFEDMNLTMQYQIIKYGEVMFCRNEQKRIRLQPNTLKMYYDFKYYSDIYNRKLLVDMKQGSLCKLSPKKAEVPYYGR